MTEQKEALKPCPFCGSNAELQYHCGVRYVQCDDEDCAVSGPLHWTDGEAVAAWNESVKGEEAADELVTLRAKLAELQKTKRLWCVSAVAIKGARANLYVQWHQADSERLAEAMGLLEMQKQHPGCQYMVTATPLPKFVLAQIDALTGGEE